jgi:hypothetical protein
MKYCFSFLVIALLTIEAFAFDITLLANNKEASSKMLTRKDRKEMNFWLGQHQIPKEDLKHQVKKVLTQVLSAFVRREAKCDLGLADLFLEAFKNEEIIEQPDELYPLLTFLRVENLIDDLFYKIMHDSLELRIEIKSNQSSPLPPRPVNLNTAETSKIDLLKLYQSFLPLSNDIQSCTLGRYFKLLSQIHWRTRKERDGLLLRLNYLGVRDGALTLEEYNRLEVLRKSSASDWPLYIDAYLNTLTQAKDKLTKNPEFTAIHSFADKYVSRREKITQRARLYKNFSSTQIVLLAQIMERTAKRLDARFAYLNFQFTDDPKGDHEIYVLSPMEQYRASVRMLRKEMGEIMRSESFRGTGVDFEDIIAAAFETGLIKSEELEHVLKFEDFWNPKTPRWKTYANFAFSLVGTATFYLPPPWNLVGAIGLIFAQSKVMPAGTPDPEDNWNVII